MRTLEAENEHLRKSLEAAGRYHPTKEFCDVCYAEVDRGVTGDWYWHWHRSRDHRGGVYCHDCDIQLAMQCFAGCGRFLVGRLHDDCAHQHKAT